MPDNEKYRLNGEDKFKERLKKLDWGRIQQRVFKGQLGIRAAEEKREEGDPRAPEALKRVTRQYELVINEIERRKAAGQMPPPVKVQVKAIPLGGSAKMS